MGEGYRIARELSVADAVHRLVQHRVDDDRRRSSTAASVSGTSIYRHCGVLVGSQTARVTSARNCSSSSATGVSVSSKTSCHPRGGPSADSPACSTISGDILKVNEVGFTVYLRSYCACFPFANSRAPSITSVIFRLPSRPVCRAPKTSTRHPQAIPPFPSCDCANRATTTGRGSLPAPEFRARPNAGSRSQDRSSSSST